MNDIITFVIMGMFYVGLWELVKLLARKLW